MRRCDAGVWEKSKKTRIAGEGGWLDLTKEREAKEMAASLFFDIQKLPFATQFEDMTFSSCPSSTLRPSTPHNVSHQINDMLVSCNLQLTLKINE